MLWNIYNICHGAAQTYVATTMIWPLNEGAFRLAWYLSGLIVGAK